MATNMMNKHVNDVSAEENLVEIWPDHRCLYDVRSPKFKDRNRRQQSWQQIAKKVNQNGWYIVSIILYELLWSYSVTSSELLSSIFIHKLTRDP